MPKLKPIAPFYDENSGNPPRPFPSILADQVELFSAPHSSSLLANEILPSKNMVARMQSLPPEREFKLVSVASPKFSRTAGLPYPTTKKSGRRQSRARSESLSELSSVSGTSDSTSDSESTTTSSTLSEDVKISKPPGKAGRPGRGGYNLESTLDWNHKAYSKFKNFTHKLIDEHLDMTKCASAQSPTHLKVVRDKARDAFPDLENYKDFWPISDVIMMRLKYTSSRARCHELEFTAGKAKRTGGGKVSVGS